MSSFLYSAPFINCEQKDILVLQFRKIPWEEDMKKLGILLLILIMMSSLFAGCAKDEDNLIGVSMPTKSLQRWNQDGENMKKELEAINFFERCNKL